MCALWNPPHAQCPWAQGHNSLDVCQRCPHICKISWRRLNTASATALWSIQSSKGARVLVTLQVYITPFLKITSKNRKKCCALRCIKQKGKNLGVIKIFFNEFFHFSKDALNWSKVTKIFVTFESYFSNKCCYFYIIYSKNSARKKRNSFHKKTKQHNSYLTLIIRNVSSSPNQHIRVSNKSCDTEDNSV